MINFGLVLLLSIIYAYSVKHRVEIFENPSNTTTDGADEESQSPLLHMSPAASDPSTYQNSASGYFVYMIYVTHLIVCRIIPLLLFAALLLTSSNFPEQFDCQWPTDTASTSHANFSTQNLMSSYSTVSCIYPVGSKNEKLTAIAIAVNTIWGTAAFTELARLLLFRSFGAWLVRSPFIGRVTTNSDFDCSIL